MEPNVGADFQPLRFFEILSWGVAPGWDRRGLRPATALSRLAWCGWAFSRAGDRRLPSAALGRAAYAESWPHERSGL